MALEIDLPVLGNQNPIELRGGLSTIIVGANGSGKTRLAIEFESKLGERAHRISAQRMLALDPAIEKIGEAAALLQLRYGNQRPQDWGGIENARRVHRWGREQPAFILNDAGTLLQVLFAEQANVAVRAYNAEMEDAQLERQDTMMRRLKAIFQRVLPNRRLEITADDIKVHSTSDETQSEPYSITQMSDGEKAVFYIIGQTLIADLGSVLIMDEPEIHVHRSILGRLWDELEAVRGDCAFLLITHDLEFAASRAGKKYVTRSYAPMTGWVIEEVPEAEGFSEELVTLILGSRKPILFVEGEQSSLDLAFYRACYPGLTVVPRGGCENVIHSVSTLRHNAAFTRIECAGLVDADGHDESDRKRLLEIGVYVLPVSEIENLLLIPSVSRAIFEMNELSGSELETKLDDLAAAVFADAAKEENINEVVLGYCRRRIDKALKKIDFSGDKSVADLAASYAARTQEIDVPRLASEIRAKIVDAIDKGDLLAFLAIYDRKKPLLALAASHLRNWRVDVFSAWVARAIQSEQDERLRKAIRTIMPEISTA